MTVGVESAVLVGRDAELGVLAAALGRVAADQPATVLVGGESGIGKSRLVREFAAAAEAHVLTGACVELGGDGLPYAPFAAALRKEFPGFAPDPEGDAGTARVRLFERVLDVLAGLPGDRPVLLVIEDVHWADRSSRDLLDFLVRNQHTLPRLLVVVTYRGEDVHRAHPARTLLAELGRLPWVRRLELRRLSRREVVEQMRAITGREPESELVNAIYLRTEGNPLFVETLLDGGASGELPASLGDLLLDRIDRLPAETGRVVRTAAAGGVAVGHRLLVAATGLDDAALSAAVRPAVDANVLTVSGDDYVFRHALIREAAYGSLLPGERAPLHRRYADALRGGPAIEAARHRIAAGDSAAALPAAWAAAEHSRAGLAYPEQLEMLEHVLRLWPEVPDATQRIGTDRLAVLEQAVEAAHGAGNPARGAELATLALSEVDDRAAPARAALLLEQRGRMRRQSGHPDDLEDLRAAVEVMPADDPARAFVLNALAMRYLEAPYPDRSRTAAEEALAIARRTGDDRARAAAMVILATLDARRGDLDVQLERLARARELAARAGADSVVMKAMLWESGLLLGFGRTGRAAEVARQALIRVRAMGLARAYAPAHAIDLIGALLANGRWDEGLDVVDHAMDFGPAPAFRAHLLCFRGLVALYRGDLDVPADAVDQGHELLAGRAGFSQDPLRLPRLEIQLRMAQDRPADALAVLDRALDLPYLPDTPRFAWMLLSLGAQTVVAAGDPALVGKLREVAGRLGVFTPVQRADSLTFEAYLAPDRAAWDAAVAAWAELERPYPLAEALLPAAEAAVQAGDRDAAAPALRQAAEITDRLGAVPLLRRIEDLGRRARIPVRAALPPDRADPEERMRLELGLTPREMEILRLVSAGLGNREIAGELFISVKTASVHVSNVIAKLGVTNRVEAAAAAHRLGLY